MNVNCAPLSVEDFKRLKATEIGTYQCFQETYHLDTYKLMHPSGPEGRLPLAAARPDRAMEAGIDDIGVGALFGLTDYRFEVMGVLTHAQYLDSQVRRRAAHDLRAAPGARSERARGEQPAARRHRRRHAPDRLLPAARGSVYGDHPLDPRARGVQKRADRPRRLADQRRFEDLARRLPRRQGPQARGRAVLDRRRPQPVRSHVPALQGQLHSQLLHRLLPNGPHGRAVHGPCQARRDPQHVRPERAALAQGVSASTTPRARPAPRASACWRSASRTSLRRFGRRRWSCLLEIEQGERDVYI